MIDSEIMSQEELEQALFDDLDEHMSQMRILVDQLIQDGPLLPENVEDLRWSHDRLSDNVEQIKFILKLFEKDIGNRGATSHVALQLRWALINAFSIGQMMHSIDGAKRLLDRERTKPASQARSALKLERAMGLRSLFARWPRKIGEKGKFEKPGALLAAAQKIEGYETLDRKTMFSYDKLLSEIGIAPESGNTVEFPT